MEREEKVDSVRRDRGSLCRAEGSRSLHPFFPRLAGHNAGRQPAPQTDGPLIRCAPALPLSPSCSSLFNQIKAKRGARDGRKSGTGGERTVGVLGSSLACFGLSYLFA